MSHILLVEDEQDIASVLRDYLHHAGHEVEHIDHGTTALARALDRPKPRPSIPTSCAT